MTKNDLRNIYKEKRKTISADEMDKLNDLILINFQKDQFVFYRIACILIWLP